MNSLFTYFFVHKIKTFNAVGREVFIDIFSKIKLIDFHQKKMSTNYTAHFYELSLLGVHIKKVKLQRVCDTAQ